MGRTRVRFVTEAALACRARSRAGSGPNQGGWRWAVVGGGERPFKLHQIGRRWAQSRLVVAMGRPSAWGAWWWLVLVVHMGRGG